MNYFKKEFGSNSIKTNSKEKNEVDLKTKDYIQNIFKNTNEKSPDRNQTKKPNIEKNLKDLKKIVRRSYTPDDKKNNIIFSNKLKTPDKLFKSNNNIDFHSIKKNLSKIYQFYCQFGERLNINYLRFPNFQKMICDAKLIDCTLTKEQVELIYTSEHKNKHPMTFESFLNTLIKISDM